MQHGTTESVSEWASDSRALVIRFIFRYITTITIQMIYWKSISIIRIVQNIMTHLENTFGKSTKIKQKCPQKTLDCFKYNTCTIELGETISNQVVFNQTYLYIYT